jgi:toxin-antitoxin system PIN domain toxin
MGYLRMVTHPRIFTSPFSQDEACEHIEALTSLPHCRVIGELAGFWGVYRALTTEVPARGNLVPDAHLAAILRQHGVVRLYTCDRDFRKFDFLQAVDPLRT